MRVVRTIVVTKDDVNLSYRHDAQVRSVFVGTDEATAERVTFMLEDPELIEGFLRLILREGKAAVPVASIQIISVASPGEWDSPGTSPEDDE